MAAVAVSRAALQERVGSVSGTSLLHSPPTPRSLCPGLVSRVFVCVCVCVSVFVCVCVCVCVCKYASVGCPKI